MRLPELEPASATPDLFISVASEPLAILPGSPQPLEDEAGNVWLIVDEGGAGTVLSFPGVADFHVDPGARRVTCHLGPDADVPSARHALLDHVVPRMLVAAGSTVLHASGIVVDGKAMLFAGGSGAGKSTLAARAMALGYPLLADDAMVLERAEARWRAQPGYPGLRLWPDSIDLLGTAFDTSPISSRSSKRRVNVAGTTTISHELGSIVMIERRPGPTAGRRLRGSEAFASLWGTVFGWPGRPVDEGLLDRVTAVATEAPVVGVGFSDDVSVSQIVDLVIELSEKP